MAERGGVCLLFLLSSNLSLWQPSLQPIVRPLRLAVNLMENHASILFSSHNRSTARKWLDLKRKGV